VLDRVSLLAVLTKTKLQQQQQHQHRVMENVDVFLGLHDFLERMRQPAAADFVKAIKRFVLFVLNFNSVTNSLQSEP
jgi:hypothetical protein